jgi:hypothetical protein
MKRVLKVGAIVTIVVAIVLGAAVFSLFQASQQVPEFYRDAVARDPAGQQGARDEFVAETTALASDLHRAGRWQHLFTVEQINAWLALELASNYPDLLSSGWHEPRVAIDEHEATLACRYENGSIATVLSLTVDAYLQQPNVVALRIRRARAGSLPVPLAQVLDCISHAARELKLRLAWRKAHGDPVALVTFPQPRDSQSIAVRLEVVELRKGGLFVAGSMERGGEHLAGADDGPDAEQESILQPLVGAAAKDTVHK